VTADAIHAACKALIEAGWLVISVADWQRAVDDGRLFIVQWGERAEALGWTAQDLFGLHDPPEQRGPNYRRSICVAICPVVL
jgi:hypothetical protein